MRIGISFHAIDLLEFVSFHWRCQWAGRWRGKVSRDEVEGDDDKEHPAQSWNRFTGEAFVSSLVPDDDGNDRAANDEQWVVLDGPQQFAMQHTVQSARGATTWAMQPGPVMKDTLRQPTRFCWLKTPQDECPGQNGQGNRRHQPKAFSLVGVFSHSCRKPTALDQEQ